MLLCVHNRRYSPSLLKQASKHNCWGLAKMGFCYGNCAYLQSIYLSLESERARKWIGCCMCKFLICDSRNSFSFWDEWFFFCFFVFILTVPYSKVLKFWQRLSFSCALTKSFNFFSSRFTVFSKYFSISRNCQCFS